jgi:hypothetical protein
MQGRLKNHALVIWLFVLLFVIIGSGLHLAAGGAFLAALSGAPLLVFAFYRQSSAGSRQSIFRRVILLTRACEKLCPGASEQPLPEDYKTKSVEFLPTRTFAPPSMPFSVKFMRGPGKLSPKPSCPPISLCCSF